MLQPTHQSLQVAAVPAAGASPARAQPSAWGRVPVRERDQDTPWHSDAVCRRDEAGLFFAPSKEPTAARLSREEAAKRVCARCPVMVECREHALLQPEPYGVWGGLTAAERRVVLARRRRRDLELKKATRTATGAVAAAG
ncbi:WhiB family transcriptional regulator [Streptomyces spectabilis]|uniref:Transcriptional regulator WhiB n=1 Tax=Streptomyces spectabilis TaxID=68270 RepID=A0A516RCS7_STRST|nr:WhiB family transcriptional regulator [Streptomyces spectabilis]MBB5107482.1 WhiB family redox-sensing transcriptional regulator [Streptomyces spectabilis]MCI3904852.1 WhiB family transcriptional regulator [Streptomyces spectabilis]QDQ13455.1 WhiB family transcriptional regulator [Streptomyces spectabilis]QEV61898.1 WhiB family transcriptional regulator [Streptomyces spectabilis]GGV02174.1 transcriptional regulator WhiB [Streptomyces spectabilis]